MITGKLYDYLRWLAQVILPALGTLYAALAGLWGLPAALEVSGSILALDAFLGVLLGISQSNYGKQVGGGVANVIPKDGGGFTYDLVLDNADLADVDKMKEIRFKIKLPEGQGPDDVFLRT